MTITELRTAYHARICREIIRLKRKEQIEYPNFADGQNQSSTKIAWEIVKQLGCAIRKDQLAGQTVGGRFEKATCEFLEEAFLSLSHLRPGRWCFSVTQTTISNFEQYLHLSYIDRMVRRDSELSSALGGNYIVKPDIIIARYPVSDDEINQHSLLLESQSTLSAHTPLRAENRDPLRPILHASISCKWTIRSDRSQNTRTEALNLIRNRKGPLPHIVAVTAEPLPTRLATLSLGTGDMDCVYHFALPELQAALQEINNVDQLDMLNMLIDGNRLRDISDLPFDLAI